MSRGTTIYVTCIVPLTLTLKSYLTIFYTFVFALVLLLLSLLLGGRGEVLSLGCGCTRKRKLDGKKCMRMEDCKRSSNCAKISGYKERMLDCTMLGLMSGTTGIEYIV